MTNERVLEIWSPAESPWSRWVKAVLFAFLDEMPMARPALLERRWNVALESDLAMIVEAPAEDGVVLGIALARAGYRPIPIYNACPFALADQYPRDVISILNARRPVLEGAAPVVNVVPVMSALYSGAGALTTIDLPGSAPPVFLLDADRRASASFIPEGAFDNRSVVSLLDFPSARFLLEQGIKRIVLVQKDSPPQPDLLYVLLAWQKEGIAVLWQEPWRKWAPEPLRIKQPFIVTRIWHKAKMAFGYHRDQFGRYGRVVPSSSG